MPDAPRRDRAAPPAARHGGLRRPDRPRRGDRRSRRLSATGPTRSFRSIGVAACRWTTSSSCSEGLRSAIGAVLAGPERRLAERRDRRGDRRDSAGTAGSPATPASATGSSRRSTRAPDDDQVGQGRPARHERRAVLLRDPPHGPPAARAAPERLRPDRADQGPPGAAHGWASPRPTPTRPTTASGTRSSSSPTARWPGPATRDDEAGGPAGPVPPAGRRREAAARAPDSGRAGVRW